MKGQWRGFVFGVFVTVMLFGSAGTAIATTGKRTVELDYDDITVTMNGSPISLVDANGNPVEPFAINGTTYLPVRAVANALGLAVDWDQSTKTVVLSTSSNVGDSSSFTLSAGSYIVGSDIPAGNYDCKAISGSGNFMGEVSSMMLGTLNELLAAENETTAIQVGFHPTYENLVLRDGDTIQISMGLVVEFTAK